MKTHLITPAVITALTPLLSAALDVEVGTHFALAGESEVEIAIQVSGEDALTDMAAIVQIGDGGPLVGGTAGPVVSDVDFTGSIWETAAGGFDALLSTALPSQILDPGASLKVAGQTVSGSGVLFTIKVDVSGFPPGNYPLLLIGTAAGNTEFQNGPQPVPATISNGMIRVLSPLEYWRWQNFPDDWETPALEATVWGDNADPDHDGLPNLMEFYLGTDPNVPTFAPATTTQPGRPVLTFIDDGGQRYPALAYTRRIDPGGVTAELQSSTTLSGWSNTGFLPVGSPVPLPCGALEFTVRRLNHPIAAPPDQRFLRLAVTAP